MEKRAEIIISGRVQKAGFRDFIDEIAFYLNLNGYVKILMAGQSRSSVKAWKISSPSYSKVNIARYPIRVEILK